MLIDFSCPIENQGVIVKTNSKTGEAYALFKLFNLSTQVVTSVTFMVHAFDAYGSELGDIKVELSDLEAQPKSFFAEKKAVSLKDYAEAKHVTVEFLEVTFAEGDPYKKSEAQTEIAVTEPDYEERLRLISVAGADAACYAQDRGTYWVCVCGRPNVAEAAECVRCGRDQKEVFENYSSQDAINKVFAQREEEKQKEEEMQKMLAEQKAAERNKKVKKYAGLSLFAVAGLVVLGFLVSLAVDGVFILMGNSAQKNGDFVKAYSYYRQADSKKVGEVSEKVRGNSTANLLHSGLMTSDEENLYYIDTDYSIFKESKSTGEKTRLGDASGFFLNVVGDWVYYLDPFTQQSISRVKKDGSDAQHLYEDANSQFAYVTVVGDEIYYIAQELRDDLTPEMQEQIAQSGSNAELYRTRLYRLKVGKEKPERVSDTDILQYLVYKDRIYYLDRTEAAVYSMDLNGKDHKKIVSGPVYNFEIVNDVLYYQDATPDPETRIPKLSIEKVALDGTYIDSVVFNRLATVFGVVDEAVYYVGFDSVDSATATLYKKTAEGEETLVDDCVGFNVREGYIFYMSSDNKVMKTKFDKSGFEEVIPQSAQVTEQEPAEEVAAE